MAVCSGCREFYLAIDDKKRLSTKENYTCPVCIALARIVDKEPKSSAFFCRLYCYAAHYKSLQHRGKHFFPILALPLEVRSLIFLYLSKNDWKTLHRVSKKFAHNIKHETFSSLRSNSEATENLARKEAAAEQVLARKEAEEELAQQKAAEELALRRKAEQELARRDAEKELARQKAAEELARKKAAEELARKKAADELARKKAEEELARLKAEEELARQLAAKRAESVTEFYAQLMASVDKDIEKAKTQKEFNIHYDQETLAILLDTTNKDEDLSDWQVVVEDDQVESVQNKVTGESRKLSLPVLLTPKIRIYEAYEEL